jgi:hypothetical protein
MENDDVIVQLGAKLDAWLDGNLATISSMDRVAQFKALLAGIEISNELDRLKVKGLAAITALLNRQDAVTEDERVATLVRGFEFGSKLACTLHDELLDVAGETEVLRLMTAIEDKLASIGSGRMALTVLLDHADARVRALAGESLLRLVPDRVLPILRDIEEKEHGNSAHFTAYNAILYWQHEGEPGKS